MTTPSSDRSHPNVTLAVLGLGAVAYAVLSSAVVPALPTMQHDLHTSETGITWLLTGYLLAASVGTSILGRLGDMYGKERLLLWTLVILAFGTLLAAVSSSLVPMIVGRFIQGAAGGIFPLAFGIVRDEFPHEKVAGSIGLLSRVCCSRSARRRVGAWGRTRRSACWRSASCSHSRGSPWRCAAPTR